MNEDPQLERRSVSVEVATPADAPELERLNEERLDELGISEEEEYFTGALEESNKDNFYLIARDQGKMVGMCQLTWSPETKRYVLRRLYVVPEQRGEKISSALFEAAKEKVMNSGREVDGLAANVEDGNDDAFTKYESWGFEIEKREEEDAYTKLFLKL